ncbi:choline dehydrogenase 6, partial [Goodea atripinnis]
PDEDLFNPDYVEVDRVLEVAVTTDTETGEEVTHYLVKWCSLSYEEATWELQEDLDPEKIREFEEIQKPPADLRHMVSRNISIDDVSTQSGAKLGPLWMGLSLWCLIGLFLLLF